MPNEDIDIPPSRLEEARLEIERARLELEKSFSRKYATPVMGLLAAVIAGIFALSQVMVATIQKSKEIETAQIEKQREMNAAQSERDRRWNLDMADFVFRNRDIIFSHKNDEPQKRIISVIAVTFPPQLTKVLFENLIKAVPDQQKPLLEEGRRLADAIQQSQQQYYVIAMTSSNHDNIDNEIARLRRKVGSSFDILFPDLEIYAPDDGLYTLLVSGKALPYCPASAGNGESVPPLR